MMKIFFKLFGAPYTWSRTWCIWLHCMHNFK